MFALIPLFITAADVLLSALIVGGSVIAASGDWNAGGLAFVGSIVNHFRVPGRIKPVLKPNQLRETMKTTKLLLLIAPVFLLGCSTLFSAKDQIETIIGVQAAGTYQVTLTKNGATLYTETWECTQGADGKLTGCHKQ